MTEGVTFLWASTMIFFMAENVTFYVHCLKSYYHSGVVLLHKFRNVKYAHTNESMKFNIRNL